MLSGGLGIAGRGFGLVFCKEKKTRGLSVSSRGNYIDTKWHSLDSNKMWCAASAANQELLKLSQNV